MQKKNPFRMLTAVLTLALSPLAQAELVTNGDFQTGNLSGWTVALAPHLSGLYVEPLSGGPNFRVLFGAEASEDDTISQSLATVAGAVYNVSFWLENGQGSTRTHFAFNWDGGPAELDITDGPQLSGQQMSYTLTATGTTTVISFSGYQYNSYYRLDDVSVTPVAATGGTVPEPASLGIVALGLLAAGGVRRRGRH